MAMLIGKFHKLIQSRLLWGIFAVLIVLSFVVWGSAPYWAKGHDASMGRVAGTLQDRKVKESELRDAISHVKLAVTLATMSSPRDLPDEQVREAAVQRLVLMAEATRLGITVSDIDVEQQIRAIPLFQQGGQFNPEVYRQFVQGFLRGQLGVTERFFLEHVRQELIVRQLLAMVSDTVVVPLKDGERAFGLLNDRFFVEYAVVAPQLVDKDTKVTDADIEAQFKKDPAHYTVPEKVVVDYVFFDSAAYATNLPVLADADMRDYYDEHASDFVEYVQQSVTNAAGAAENKMLPRARPLEEVKTDVAQRLSRAIAMDRAEVEATKLVGRIAGDNGAPMSFSDAAVKAGLTVKRCPPFSPGEAVTGVETSPEFYESAMALNSGEGMQFSSAVRGKTGIYVLYFVKRVAPRIPELAEVKDAVAADTRVELARRALKAKADMLRAHPAAFAKTAASLGIAVVAKNDFSLSDDLRNEKYAAQIGNAAVRTNPGECAEPEETQDGGMIVVHVKSREPASDKLAPGKISELMRMISVERTRDIVAEWQAALVKKNWKSAQSPAARAKDTTGTEEDDSAPARPQPPVI